MDVFELHRGDSPLILSMPHSGVELPPGLASRFHAHAVALPDTDWHIPRLYDFATGLDATIIRANYSRYVIDLNRPPSGESLYPGQATTDLCPTTTFGGDPLYEKGEEPSDAQIAKRRENYWEPYHLAIANEIKRVKAAHGYAVLYDCHSIASEVPRLFEGTLPVLNLGTAKSTSCDPVIERLVAKALSESEFNSVLNGRFVGGYITRNYGQPGDGVHAVQMEIGQDAYMNRGPGYQYREDRAESLRDVLKTLLLALISWRPN
ncbi:N-formylglutamate deformylase [Stratiformator vulcanicus]|uniref:N-formylglutamate amidohydrolase n=1 Tax=Stratiformator vulcanicus TaxID=2527980 RepID=A0A517R321_9PLAN|nr:N-formylglutamate deformylase [Stratiformator vulcanicus]QDT38237.1 N-formylglutamate amidohydrolase [Stratiformator vulcanicus]